MFRNGCKQKLHLIYTALFSAFVARQSIELARQSENAL